jgi:SAM-dependent methyltransferase
MDVYGNALLDFHQNGSTEILWLHNSYGEPEEMPIDVFFREEREMPDLELKALSFCKGNILDVGAGVGSHTLLLQEKGAAVTAIDISPLAVKIMLSRGVKNALLQDVDLLNTKYDTLLFLMNGIGLTGTIAGFNDFLSKAKDYINPKGQLIFDSSDISYLYEDLEMPNDKYFGEVNFCYEYKGQKGDWFNWLYIDKKTLTSMAREAGWLAEIIFDDGEDQYLAKLTLIS